MIKRLKHRLIITYTVSMILIVVASLLGILYVSYSNYSRELQVRSQIRQNEQAAPEQSREDILIVEGEVNSPFVLTDDELNKINEAISKKQKYINISDDFYYISRQNDIVKLTNVTQSLYSLMTLLLSSLVIIIVISLIIYIVALKLTNKLLQPVITNYENQKKFVSDASHELKTPLQVIKNSLNLIKEDDDESEKWINYSIKETERLEKLTNNLLTLSRDSDASNVKPIDASIILHEFITSREVLLFESGYNFKYDIEDKIKIAMYEDDLIQILNNLLDNAIKYSDQRRQINILLSSNKQDIILRVCNSSDYIGQNQLDKLSNRFYRVDDTHNSQSNSFGLGLSIVKKLIEKYDFNYRIYYEDTKFIYEIKIKR